MEVRPGWTIGTGAIFAAIGILLGLLIAINVAPNNPLDVGVAVIILGVSRILP